MRRNFTNAVFKHISIEKIRKERKIELVQHGKKLRRERMDVKYKINSVPEAASREKGYASYPEDFPHLQPGEDFAIWRSGEDWEIETLLNGVALQERLRIFERGEDGHSA